MLEGTGVVLQSFNSLNVGYFTYFSSFFIAIKVSQVSVIVVHFCLKKKNQKRSVFR